MVLVGSNVRQPPDDLRDRGTRPSQTAKTSVRQPLLKAVDPATGAADPVNRGYAVRSVREAPRDRGTYQPRSDLLGTHSGHHHGVLLCQESQYLVDARLWTFL